MGPKRVKKEMSAFDPDFDKYSVYSDSPESDYNEPPFEEVDHTSEQSGVKRNSKSVSKDEQALHRLEAQVEFGPTTRSQKDSYKADKKTGKRGNKV